jgi:6-phosphogluconolactonase
MKSTLRKPAWTVLDTAGAVAREGAARILAAAASSIARRGVFRLVLAGGRTPIEAYRQLVDADTDWTRWHIYFGDERCLPADHKDRNSAMAADAWLGKVPVPEKNIAVIPAELGPGPAASAYAQAVRGALPFDLVLLGMGEDGHTASLFPGHPEADRELVLAVQDAPKPPPQRVSLSSTALSTAREVLFLVTGAGKCAAVNRWRAGEPLPVSRIRPKERLEILVDAAAWGRRDREPD